MNSDLRIEHLSGGQLRVTVPPYLTLFLIFGGIAAIFAAFLIYRALKMRSFMPLILFPLMALPFVIAGGSSLRNGSVILDRAAGVATVVQPSFFWSKTSTLPLASIQRAQLYFARSSSRVVLVLQDGSAVGFSDSTTQTGQGEAVQAINDYLGVRGR